MNSSQINKSIERKYRWFFNAHLVNLLNKLESSKMSLDSSICIVFNSI